MSDDPLRLRAAVVLLGIDPNELWIDCLALGGEYVTEQQVADVLDLTPSATVDRTVQDIIRLALNERALELGMAPLFSDFPGPDGGVRADVAASRRRSRALRARADRAMDASAELSATYARLAAHPRIAQR